MLNTEGGNRPVKLLLDSFKNTNEEPAVGKILGTSSSQEKSIKVYNLIIES
jgi:hypothetical protein